jgi:hypothetical protein
MDKSNRFIALLFIVCLPAFSQDYFPLHLNDEWRYKRVDGDTGTYLVCRIVDTVTVTGQKYFVKKSAYYMSEPYFDTLRNDNNVVYAYSNNHESVLCDLRCSTEVRDTVESMITFKWPIDTLTLGDTMLSHLVYYLTDYVGMADGQRATWYANNIGIIQEAYFRAQPTLTYAYINGRTVITAKNAAIRFFPKRAGIARHKTAGIFDFLGRKIGNIPKSKSIRIISINR